jgi:hypothetical protein
MPCFRHKADGWVAERFKAPVLKTGVGASLPWVRIPPHPNPHKKRAETCPCWHKKQRWVPLQNSCCEDTGIAAKRLGELGGIRTLDLQIKSPLLYQLSYELSITNHP